MKRKICAFLKLNMSNKDIAQITFQSDDALKKGTFAFAAKTRDRQGNQFGDFPSKYLVLLTIAFLLKDFICQLYGYNMDQTGGFT